MTKLGAKGIFKRVVINYVLEILIIFVGISISFMFDEWREGRKDEQTAIKHLTILRSNLKQDTLILSQTIKMAKNLIQSSNKLAYFKSEKEISDSINFHIDNAASYLGINFNQTAFEEIKGSANTNLIKNDSLKRAFLGYYTSMIKVCNEWTAVDKTHTMDQLIPEMNNYFPVVEEKFSLVTTKEKIAALRTKKLRNILLANVIYKQATIDVMLMTNNSATKLLKRVEAELEDK